MAGGLCFVSSEEKGLVIFLDRTICNLASDFIVAHYTPKLHVTTASPHQDNCFCNQAKANRIKLVQKNASPLNNQTRSVLLPIRKIVPCNQAKTNAIKMVQKNPSPLNNQTRFVLGRSLAFHLY
jgi:hypothetical protein